jgi:hypothetical protein
LISAAGAASRRPRTGVPPRHPLLAKCTLREQRREYFAPLEHATPTNPVVQN